MTIEVREWETLTDEQKNRVREILIKMQALPCLECLNLSDPDTDMMTQCSKGWVKCPERCSEYNPHLDDEVVKRVAMVVAVMIQTQIDSNKAIDLCRMREDYKDGNNDTA